MRNRVCFFVAFSALVSCATLTVGDAALPVSARSAKQQYLKELEAAKQTHDKAVEKAFEEYVRQLQLAMKKETETANLDNIVAIQAERDSTKRQGPPVFETLISQQPAAAEGKTKKAAEIARAKKKRGSKKKIRTKGKVSREWQKVVQNSARVDVAGLDPTPLRESDEKEGWSRVPPAFNVIPQTQAIAYSVRKGMDNGVADFKVTRDGYVLVACNYGYQGNRSGDWDEKRWTKEKFLQNGWLIVPETMLGGVLVKGGGHDQVVFVKHMEKGEHYRLRCNKYAPPFVIIFFP